MHASVCLGVARERAAADSGPTPRRAVTAARTAGARLWGARGGRARGGALDRPRGRRGARWRWRLRRRRGPTDRRTRRRRGPPAHERARDWGGSGSGPARGAARGALGGVRGERGEELGDHDVRVERPALDEGGGRAGDLVHRRARHAHQAPTERGEGIRERASRPKDLYHPSRGDARHGRLRRAVDVRQQRGHLRLDAPLHHRVVVGGGGGCDARESLCRPGCPVLAKHRRA